MSSYLLTLHLQYVHTCRQDLNVLAPNKNLFGCFQTLAQWGVASALVALSKNDSKNIKELIARVLNAICKFPELRGIVVQQGGSKSLLPLALEGTNKGKRHAAQALARIGISQDPAIAFPGQRVSYR